MKKQKSESERWNLAEFAVVAVLASLAMVGTLILRIPIPATTGYFNLGDVFVILAALWWGPRVGFLVGLIGPASADLIGFPQFVLATAVVKGMEGLLVGIIGGGPGEIKLWRRFVAAIVGGLWMVAGYFIFEASVYPYLGRSIPFFAVTDYAAAMVEMPINLIQGLVSAFIGVSLWKTVSGMGILPDKKQNEARESGLLVDENEKEKEKEKAEEENAAKKGHPEQRVDGQNGE